MCLVDLLLYYKLGIVFEVFIIKAPLYSPMWIIVNGSGFIFQGQRITLLSTVK